MESHQLILCCADAWQGAQRLHLQMLPAKNKQKDLPQTWEKGPGQKHQLCPMGLAKLPEVLGCEGCSAWSHSPHSATAPLPTQPQQQVSLLESEELLQTSLLWESLLQHGLF